MYRPTPARPALRVLTVVFWGLRSDLRGVFGRVHSHRQFPRVVAVDDRRIVVGDDVKPWCYAGLVA